MFKKYFLALALSLMVAPAALAEELVIEDELTTVTMAEDTMLCGGGCGYWGGVYINVYTTVSAEVDSVSLYANYYIDNAESKEDAVEELDAAFEDIKSTLTKYGTVVRTGVYTYTDWEYTGMYDGSLSVRVDLNNASQTEGVEDLLYANGFDSWREVTVTSLTSAEKTAVPTLKEMIADKKEVYEEFLESDLGSISSVNIYSWPDSTSFDPSTGMVDVFVYADVTYNTLY